jgi:hypothetical protein
MTHDKFCAHEQATGVKIPSFLSEPPMTPKIFPWDSIENSGYPSIRGRVELYNITFAKFGTPCKKGIRANSRDYAIAVNNDTSDANHPIYVKNVDMFGVEQNSFVNFPVPNPSLISQVIILDFADPKCEPYFMHASSKNDYLQSGDFEATLQ